MAFTYDVTTARGKVRLTIADTSATAYAFEDAEIDYFLTEADDEIAGASYLAVLSLLSSKARRVKAATVGDTSYDDRAQVEALQALADRLADTSGQAMRTVTSMGPETLPMDTAYVEVG